MTTTRGEVRVLGQLAVTFADGREPVTKFRTQKAALLLAYLALHPGKAHAREFLIELLWPDTEPAAGRNNLSVALSTLRRQLEHAGGKSLFDVNHTTIRLRHEGIGVDAQRFEALVKRGLHTRLDPAERHTALTEALALWAPPLPGIYDDWAIAEQTRLEALAEQAREALESLPELPVAEVAAPAPIVHALPVAFSRFLGRKQECAAIAAQLQTARLVTLLGPGGVGKTRLALEVARASQEQKAFTRIVFASLAELPLPSLILPTLRRVLTDAPPAPDPLVQLVTTINAIPGRVLVLLDNLEHLLPAESKDAEDDDEEKSRFGPARIVRQLLEPCPNLVILATSRQPLGMEGEQQVSVEPLAGPTGVELFVDRVRTVRADFTLHAGNQAELEAICTLLDGLPLAIELAAAWVRVLTLKELRERLEKEVLWLEGRRRDLNPRQKSLKATLRWSWQLLHTEQKRLLSALSVFRGGWTLDAVEAVNPMPETLDLLYSLVDKSLVVVEQTPDSTRYRLLETIRQFAHERLEESGDRERVRSRHLAYFLAFAERVERQLTGVDQALWLARLEEEHGNLRTALEWSRNSGSHLRLAKALARFWLVRGYFSEGREHLLSALAENPDATGSLRAKALNWAGSLADSQSDFRCAQALCEESLAIARELGEQKSIANTLVSLGNVAFSRGEFSLTCTRYEESLAILRELGEKRGTDSILNNLGNVAVARGDYASARALYEESLAVARELGEQRNIANALNNVGFVTYSQGNYALSGPFLEESEAIYAKLGDRRCIAQVLSSRGYLAYVQGDYALARLLLEESVAILRELSDSRGVALSLVSLGSVILSQGDHAAARLHLEESLTIARELGAPRCTANALERFGDIASATGATLLASQLWGATERLREEIGTIAPPNEQQAQSKQVASARTRLNDDAAFDAAWAEGRALTREQAIALALEKPKSLPPTDQRHLGGHDGHK